MDAETQRAIDEIKSTRKDDEERLRELERTMVSDAKLQDTLDRSTAPVHKKLDKLDATLATLTLALGDIPLQAQRIMALEQTSTSPSGVSGKTLGTIIGGLIATLAACGAAVKNFFGGD